MRRLSILFIIVFTGVLSANPTGLLGIKLGSNYKIAVKSLSVRYRMLKKSPIMSVYSGTVIDGKAIIAVQQYKSKVMAIMIVYSSGNMCIDRFNKLRSLMKSKYGKPAEIRKYVYPYEHGDGHTLTAIRIGKATIQDVWKWGELTGFIRINRNLSVMLTYYHNKLADAQEAEEKMKRKKIL